MKPPSKKSPSELSEKAWLNLASSRPSVVHLVLQVVAEEPGRAVGVRSVRRLGVVEDVLDAAREREVLEAVADAQAGAAALGLGVRPAVVERSVLPVDADVPALGRRVVDAHRAGEPDEVDVLVLGLGEDAGVVGDPGAGAEGQAAAAGGEAVVAALAVEGVVHVELALVAALIGRAELGGGAEAAVGDLAVRVRSGRSRGRRRRRRRGGSRRGRRSRARCPGRRRRSSSGRACRTPAWTTASVRSPSSWVVDDDRRSRRRERRSERRPAGASSR